MSNSKLVAYTKISLNKNPRKNSTYNPTGKITKITIHHMAGNLSVESCGNVFQTREASANYGIDSNGKVGMYVEENYRSWASSSPENDYKAVTIEVANDGGADTDWHVSDKALAKLIDLCVDICRRNGIDKLTYTGDSKGNLTRHNMFAATTCPGPYLQGKFPYIAEEVNKRLGADKPLYRVRKSWKDASSQLGAFEKLDNAKAMADKNKGYTVFDENGKEVYSTAPKSTKINVTYCVQANGRWLPEVKNLEDYAGNDNQPITALMVKVDKGKIKYRVHLAKENRWLNWITGYNKNDFKNGYAGNGKGHPIDGVQVYFYTPDDVRPYQQAYYRVSEVGRSGYLHWIEDTSTANGSDGYAGNLNGKAIDRIQIQIKER